MLIHSIFIALDRGTVLPEPCILIPPSAFQTMEQVEVSSYKTQTDLREMLLFPLRFQADATGSQAAVRALMVCPNFLSVGSSTPAQGSRCGVPVTRR